jgi:hypothetical protein
LDAGVRSWDMAAGPEDRVAVAVAVDVVMVEAVVVDVVAVEDAANAVAVDTVAQGGAV